MTDCSEKALAEVDRLIEAEDLDEAILHLQELVKISPDDPDLLRRVLDVAFNIPIFEMAAHAAIRLVELFPSSEVDSLGLFHCYYCMGEIEKAFAEMRRLLSIGRSEEYETLIRSLIVDLGTRSEDLSWEEKRVLENAQAVQSELERRPPEIGSRELINAVTQEPADFLAPVDERQQR